MPGETCEHRYANQCSGDACIVLGAEAEVTVDGGSVVVGTKAN